MQIKKTIVSIVLIYFSLSSLLHAHCQVPCGIYNDAVRIVDLEEDIATISKAMRMIKDLSGSTDAQSLNQITRWVSTKEDHAKKIQETISNYFLAQRIKAKQKGDSERQKYVNETLVLHQLIVAAMKCKQTVDINRSTEALDLVRKFSDSYFDDHGMRYLDLIRNGK